MRTLKSCYTLLLLSCCLLLSACSEVVYLGDKLPPTTTTDIYYDAHDVKREYKTLGHLTYPRHTQENIKNTLSAYAKKIGADAIIITGTDATKDDQAAVVKADAIKYTN